MTQKLLRCFLLSVLLMLALASNAVAAKRLTLTGATGGTVQAQPFGSGAYTTLVVNSGFRVDDNDIVSLLATPANGYLFSHWTGNVSNTGIVDPYIAMGNNNQSIAAVFTALHMNTITVNFAGLGSGSVSLSAGTTVCPVTTSGGSCSFSDNSSVSLTATASGGATFTGWSGAVSGSGIATLNVGTSNHTVTATFAPPAAAVKTLTLNFAGDGGGRVSLAGSSTSYPDTTSGGTYSFNTGETVTLTATPGTDIDFLGWSGAANATSAGISVTLDSNMTIRATFDDPAIEPTIAGCATSVGSNYLSGFDANDFSLIGVSVINDTSLQLDTGNAALNPNAIIIPFKQEVAVTFLYEGAGYTSNDLGWLYGSEDPATKTPRPIYNNINDNNNDGVLDRGLLDNGVAITDRNGDGVINARDNRVSLGIFEAGQEIVFSLRSGDGANSDPTFFTKTAWNPDTWNGGCAGDSFTKTYYLGLPLTESACNKNSNWMNQPAIDRLSALFDLTFTATDTQTLSITRNQKFSHVIVGTPADKPNEWVLGWEDLPRGGDTDHNDVIFQIERKTGGSVQLLPAAAIRPREAGAYFTAITLEVTDEMPGAGASSIAYEVSIDGGSNWVAITHWDTIKGYPLDNNGDLDTTADLKTAGVEVSATWTDGTPATTFRSVRIDFAGMNLTGDQLLWRANFTSDNEIYQPAIHDVQLDADVATNGDVSHSTPIIQGNVLFNTSYETPALSWNDKSLRGHLRAMRIYDPVDPNSTDYVELWDAAGKLQQKSPSTRNIKYPEMTITTVASEALATGDGSTTTFSGTLSAHPVLATTLKISDSRETFTDNDINSLFGSLSQGATGTINRYTGEYTLTFNQAPGNNVAITASYSAYALSGNLRNFTRAFTPDSVLALDSSFTNGAGYDFDFDRDGDFDSADGNWLVNWTRGYVDGATTKKEGILGPIDHSTPAVISPPGKPAWYFGTSITKEERTSYEAFRVANENRRSIVVAGSRNGMLHAFDAGAFRWGDNPKTDVKENRGYYLWPDNAASNYTSVKNWWSSFLGSLASSDPPYFRWQDTALAGPDYGTGEELWAFIPANLMPRLKNNVLEGEDRAYVDASPAVANVYIDADDDGSKEWRTVVLSAEGNGGDSIFCLDVTNPAAPEFLWEFADPTLFRSRSSAAVAVIGRIFDVNAAATKWVAFFVSGRNYDANAYPSVYMVDIDTGTVLKKIVLDAVAAGKGGVPSGQPAIIDSDGNGYIDRGYIGTDKGYLYKINFPDSPTSPGNLSTVLVNHDFIAEDGTSVAADQQYHPIYASPSVVVDNGLTSDGSIDYNIRIFFGTGDSPYFDEDINTGNTRYQFFAYNDKAGKNVATNSAIRLEWFYELPAGHRIFASAFAAAGQVYFGSATSDTENPCDGPNEGRVFAFSYDGHSVLNDEQGDPGILMGDISNGLLVEDEHLILNTPTGVEILGDKPYNNESKQGGLPKTETTYWREIF